MSSQWMAHPASTPYTCLDKASWPLHTSDVHFPGGDTVLMDPGAHVSGKPVHDNKFMSRRTMVQSLLEVVLGQAGVL